MSEPTQSQKKERARTRATCHPDLPRKTSDGLCGNCYSRRKYQTDAEYRETKRARGRAAARKRSEAASPILSFACAYCGAMHTPKIRHPRYRACPACSRKARYRQGDRSPRPCEQCGDTFEPRRSFQKFCTRRCGEVSKSAYASWDEWQEAKRARVRRRLEKNAKRRIAELAKLARLDRRCEWCNDPMRSDHASKRFCSERHGRLAGGFGVSCTVFYTECAGCGDLFVGRQPNARYCSRGCAKARSRWPISPKKRAKIIERDQGSCQLCGFPVDPEDIQEVEGKDGRPAIIAGPRYPSIDHIVPRSEGGDHTMANLRLAHRDCNSVRGAAVSVQGEQLRLVG